MATWSRDSQKVYNELDGRLQRFVTRIRDEVHDISLLEGFRSAHKQNQMFAEGKSQKMWPNGKHNKLPSLAVDLQPYPRHHDEKKLWCQLGYIAGAGMKIAEEEGFTIRWGGNWNGNTFILDSNFLDLWHIEIREDMH
jgi:peptidoglycan L-alanyl-D-glutamate endopeptidase CwlK